MTIAQNFPTISPSLLLDFANVQALDSRVTFTRATTATYYGTRTTLAEQNLLLQSQTFDNAAWATPFSAVSVIANTTTAPDGTVTADRIENEATTTQHIIRTNGESVTSGQTYVCSVYVQAGNAPYAFLSVYSGTSIYAGMSVDLSTNAVLSAALGTGWSVVSATSTQVASSAWYRLVLTFVSGSTGSVFPSIGIGESSGAISSNGQAASYLGTDGVGYFIWGAQLEQRSSVTAYQVTTTQPVSNYVPVLETAASGVARFDHNPTTFESLGLEMEEQRTNLLLQSEDLDTTWSETRATLSLNSVIAPNGTLTADVLIASTDNNTHFTTQTFTGTATSHTFSAYAKANGLNHVALRLFNGATQVGLAYYNLSTGATGTVTAGTASIQSVGNGWYRCSLTATLAASASCTADIFLANADNTNSFAGNAFSGVSLWGFQVEAGVFATSYIPTVASQVTRAADAASMTGTNFSSWYTQGEGTLYVESLTQNITFSNNKNLQLNDGTINNEIWIGSGSPPTSSRSQITLGGVGYFASSLTNQVTAGQFGKYAISFETNNAVLCANGTLGTVDTDVPIPSSINQLTIIPPQRAGYYKKIAYYPVAVTSAQLQALTG